MLIGIEEDAHGGTDESHATGTATGSHALRHIRLHVSPSGPQRQRQPALLQIDRKPQPLSKVLGDDEKETEKDEGEPVVPSKGGAEKKKGHGRNGAAGNS